MTTSHPIPDAALESDIAILGKKGRGKSAPIVAPTMTDCAYAAGFFDGEGNVVIARNNCVQGTIGTTYNMRVMASQDELAPLQFLQDRWCGSIRAKAPRPNGKINHHWCCFSRQAAKFLTDVMPFLVLKKERAELALLLQSKLFVPGKGGHSAEHREELEALKVRMLKLNGYPKSRPSGR